MTPRCGICISYVCRIRVSVCDEGTIGYACSFVRAAYTGDMRYVVGLGNPGAAYRDTRHNVGREVVVAFHVRHAAAFTPWTYDKYRHAHCARGSTHGGEGVLLMVPERYMNESGEIFSQRRSRLEEGDALIVVHDDLDLPLGAVRVSHGRGSGGHRGVDSLLRVLGTREFTRVRIGIAPQGEKEDVATRRRPRGREAVSRFVLGAFGPGEREVLRRVQEEALDKIEALVFSPHTRRIGAIAAPDGPEERKSGGG